MNPNLKTFEDILLKYIGNSISPTLTASELKTIASDVIQLSNFFTKDREVLPPQYLNNKRLRRAYILYFLPSNIYKIHLPLKELSLHPKKILSKKELKILDLGSGPGTTILGILDFFSNQKKRPSLEFTAIDSVAENLSIAKDLFKLFTPLHPECPTLHGMNGKLKSSLKMPHPSKTVLTLNQVQGIQGRGVTGFTENINIDASLKTFKINIEKAGTIPQDTYDIIILSNILNELSYGDNKRIAERVSFLNTIIDKFLTPDGSCIIIEPALRETTREMLEIRDSLVKNGFKIYSPCLMNQPCPALLNPKDWCHEDIPWIPPVIIKEIDKLTGLRKDSLKFSYLVLRKDKLSLTDVLEKNSYRIVSEPLISKGKIEFFICGNRGRQLITRLDKDKTPSNIQFQELQRGDIVTFKDLIDEGKRFKAGKDTIVYSSKLGN